MKKLMFLIGLSALVLAGCSSSDDELVGNWKMRSDLTGYARCAAVSFTVGGKGYVGTGSDGSKDRYKDFWEYTPDGNYGTWKQCADMPDDAIARSHATAFGSSTAGYVGLGIPLNSVGNDYLNDFWEYTPSTNTWRKIADFPGTGRYGAFGFFANGKGYVGAGDDKNLLKDFFEYNPSSDTWTEKSNYPGAKRRGASVFVINDVAYVCCGYNNSRYPFDFFAYDAKTDTWSQKRNINDSSDESYDDDYNIVRSFAGAFTVGGRGYISCGENNGSLRNDTWEYDPNTDLWEEKTGYEGYARQEPVALSINGRGFLLTGRTSSNILDDMMEFFPFEEQVDND